MITAPLVTIILPTYNRPETLRVSISSVVIQTFKNWQLLVLGDCCSESTAAVLDEFKDIEKIKYVNFSRRAGEQALLNSAGTIVADSEYISYLNHDDIWFPDHLEIALNTLTESGRDFFAGRAATIKYVNKIGGEYPSVKLKYANPYRRSLKKYFFHNTNYFEPVSTWIIRTSVARNIGPWRASSEVFRAPIQDWVLRAWRVGAELVSDERITCFRMTNHHQPRVDKAINQYGVGAEMHKVLFDLFDRKSADQVREKYAKKIKWASLRKWRMRRTIPSRSKVARLFDAIIPFFANRYHVTGRDVFDDFCKILSIPKGKHWKKALAVRTGEHFQQTFSLAEIVNELRSGMK